MIINIEPVVQEIGRLIPSALVEEAEHVTDVPNLHSWVIHHFMEHRFRGGHQFIVIDLIDLLIQPVTGDRVVDLADRPFQFHVRHVTGSHKVHVPWSAKDFHDADLPDI